ncbi:16S rRNA (guanine(966)-N(2))-methyltransferase RsmD [Pseudactinotalea terrae]|uniref:16S rRNA (guanine(966)-N(2))-methyltransferase RsmD n=1 Tax=Pseudactinotalea terrae TaxID=1743262 RepID=UPI0012E25623|nr:16S rRNA (guanine(966)-N(2))-methyltransferase RsmD [Pseudactinotalea terrae]
MTRIVGGSAGGRRLAVPATGTRPTSERVREALFSRLDHRGALDGARVLDLYAGSGALGLEALSRGAASAVLVDSSRTAVAVCTSNARSIGFADSVTVISRKVEQLLAGRAPTRTSTLVFIDPPYDLGIERVLRLLTRPGWLAEGAVVVLEQSSRAGEPTWPEGLQAEDSKVYGETTLWFATAVAAASCDVRSDQE